MKLFLLGLLLLLPQPAFAVSASQFQPKVAYETVTVTIASSTTVSSAIDLNGTTPVGIFLPSTFNGTALTFQASATSDGTYVAVEDGAASAANVTLTATAASKYIAIPAAVQDQLRGLRFLKIVTSTAQADTDTVITLALRPL